MQVENNKKTLFLQTEYARADHLSSWRCTVGIQLKFGVHRRRAVADCVNINDLERVATLPCELC